MFEGKNGKEGTKMKIKHDENREKEIQLLCAKILEENTEFEDDPNGPYSYHCPYCYNRIKGGREIFDKPHGMDDIQHELDCPYVIAKGLKT